VRLGRLIRARWATIAATSAVAILLVTTLPSATPARVTSVSPIEWRPGTTEWDPVALGQHGFSLELAYREGCFSRNYHAKLRETRFTITVAIRVEHAVFPPGTGVVSCPAPKQVSLVLRLAHSLAGRLIAGPSEAKEPRSAFGYRGFQSEPVEVPSLIGFAPKDASLALDFGYLRGQVRRTNASSGLPRVVAQKPSAGQVVARESVVRLVAARDAQK
jgi:hypothetical protein